MSPADLSPELYPDLSPELAADLSVLTRRTVPLEEMVAVLREQHDRKLDVVVPAGRMRARGGRLEIDDLGEPVLSADGVTSTPGRFYPTSTCDGGVAEKLRIPRQYLRRMRTEGQHDLYDTNVNTWLDHDPDRRFLVRTLRGRHGGTGIARALLSDSYRVIDNLAFLLAVLEGIRTSGARVQVTSTDLTERRMYVKITSDVTAEAPTLLRNYRSPFSGASGADCPIVAMGAVISNSEVGAGASAITPRITVQVCDNGMTVTKDAMRAVHLGRQLEEGVVQWSAETERKALDLVTAKARDAVSTFLNADYMARKLGEIGREAGIAVNDPQATIEHVARQLSYSEAEQATILAHFIAGADCSTGGVLHAVTSAAQTLPDADDAYELERSGLQALSVAAAFQN